MREKLDFDGERAIVLLLGRTGLVLICTGALLCLVGALI